MAFFSFVIDVFSHRIIGWQFASHMRTDLVLDALWMALTRRPAGADVRLIHHADPFSSGGTRALTSPRSLTHGVLASIGSYDNALAESFVDSFKAEVIADRVWRARSQLELAILT